MTEAAGPGLIEMLRVLAALAAVLALVVFASWFLRRAQLGRKGGVIRVEDRVGLAKGVQVVVVNVEGRRLLLGVSEKTVNLVTELDEIPDADGAIESEALEVAAPVKAGAVAASGTRMPFAEALSQAWRARRGK